MSNLRQEKRLVLKLSEAQLIKLKANRDREDWYNDDSDYFIEQIREKLKGLCSSCAAGNKEMAWNFAADIANFAAMAATVTQIEKEP